jgi:hypothetical protein
MGVAMPNKLRVLTPEEIEERHLRKVEKKLSSKKPVKIDLDRKLERRARIDARRKLENALVDDLLDTLVEDEC